MLIALDFLEAEANDQRVALSKDIHAGDMARSGNARSDCDGCHLVRPTLDAPPVDALVF